MLLKSMRRANSEYQDADYNVNNLCGSLHLKVGGAVKKRLKSFSNAYDRCKKNKLLIWRVGKWAHLMLTVI